LAARLQSGSSSDSSNSSKRRRPISSSAQGPEEMGPGTLAAVGAVASAHLRDSSAKGWVMSQHQQHRYVANISEAMLPSPAGHPSGLSLPGSSPAHTPTDTPAPAYPRPPTPRLPAPSTAPRHQPTPPTPLTRAMCFSRYIFLGYLTTLTAHPPPKKNTPSLPLPKQ
jgi:hypothetical protein